ncbi:MAG: MG2 domain-containing protein [bacterium]
MFWKQIWQKIKQPKILILSLIIIALLGVSLFLIKEKPIPLVEKIKSIKIPLPFQPKPAEKEFKITMQPEGLLKEFPKEITFYFEEGYAEASGLKIEDISNSIKIEPKIKTSGTWINEWIFQASFLESLKPETKYKVEICSIPLTIPKAIPHQNFSFTTPGFTAQIFLSSYENQKPRILLDFTFEPVLEKITEYLEIHNSKGKRITPSAIEKVQEKPNQVIFSLPIIEKADEFSIVLKKGLPCTSGFFLKNNIQAKIPVSPITMSITEHRIEEADDGYLVVFSAASDVEKNIDLVIDEKNISHFINITPEIPLDITTSRNRIYILSSNFLPQKEYTITLRPGIRSKKGSLLKEEYTCTFTTPEKKRKLQFIYSGRHFGKTGNWNLPLKVTGIKKLNLDVVYLPPENTLFWHLRDWSRTDYFWDLGEEVIKDSPISVEKDGILWINLKDYLKDTQPGTYLVRSRTVEGKYVEDNIIVVLSDLSIVAKWFKKDLQVWCFNSSNLKPEDNVDIEVRTSKNFVFGKGTTDADGKCHISSPKEERQPYIIFAKKGDEWTYLYTPGLSIPLSQYDIQGEDPEIPYLAYIYPERELYRPGETANVGVLVRERNSFKGVSIPVKINIRDPKGNNFLSLSGKTDEYGLCTFVIPTSASSPTGKYIIELIAGDKTLYTTGIFVECFVPERMRVNLSLPKEGFDPYKPFPLKIAAEYLFGAPADNEKYHGKARFEETPFKSSGYLNYSFGPVYLKNEKPPVYEEAIDEGYLDEKGEASVDVCIPPEVKFNNPILFIGNVEVEEGGSGRVTRKRTTKEIYTKPFYIGINPDVTRIIENKPCNVSGVLLKPKGDFYQKKTTLYYQIFRLSYHYSYRYWDDDNWKAILNKIPVTQKKILSTSDGKFAFSFIPKTSWADYLIEVGNEDNDVLSQTKVCGWGWWWGEDEETTESPEVLSLRLDKKEYDVGEEVKVSASLPFEGNILWTVELDKVYESSFQEAKGKIANWSFNAPKGVSTVYVTGLLVRSGENYLVQRAFGVCRVKIRPKELKLALDIESVSQMKPQTELLIKVKAQEKFKATIAVVDEGILQITDFKTPDPYEGILRNLRLCINSCESFGWLVKKFMERPSGGFMAREKEFPEARFARIVSFWSKIQESDKDGNVIYKVKIPQYNGRLRVMAVAVGKDSFSSAEKGVVVKSNVIISPTIPRFMSSNDTFSFPITLINTTKKEERVDISMAASGACVNPNGIDLFLSANEKRTLWFNGKADDVPGAISIKIKAKSRTEIYQEDFVIPLYPDVPYLTQSDYVDIKPNQSVDLTPYLKNWYPRAHTSKIVLSSCPGMSRLSHAKYAIGYPYGCIEQTSTSLLVLLRLSSLLPIIAPDISKEKYVDMVNHGIRRLVSMQTISGALSFWPGEDCEASPYSNAYACFVLLEAKASGFLVPESIISSLLSWLDRIDDKNGYRFYVLAKGGLLKKKPDVIDRLMAQGDKKEFSSKDLLWIAASLHQIGKVGKAKEFLQESLKTPPENIRRYYDDFYSSLQQLAMRLYVVNDMMPNSGLEKKLVDELITNLSHRESYWYTTQELAWGLVALGRYVERKQGVEFSGEIKMNNKILLPKKEKYGLLWILKNPGDKNVVLKTKSDMPLFLNIENTGFCSEKRSFEPYSKNISIERKVFDYYGREITSSSCGKQAIVELKVWSDNYYENVAVELPIPAGFEIENPRLTKDSLPNWASDKENLWMPNYVDIRDDRAIIFGRTAKEPRFYYIQVRAVTPGIFFFPPAQAMAMYDPEIRANIAAGRFEIER